MTSARGWGRSVSLAVCDGKRLLGETPAVDVATPFWQDTEPIQARFPQLVVLRVLGGSPMGAGAFGGAVCYLAELAPFATPSERLALDLRRTTVDETVLEEHPLRMPWARPGGPQADLDWAVETARRHGLEVTGLARQHRTWNLSAIWSLPVRTRGGQDRRVFVKCLPQFSHHEAAVLRLLRGASVPLLMAADAHRMLLAEMPGRDGYGADLAQAKRLVEHLVDLQLQTAPLLPSFVSAGVPDARGPSLADTLSALVARRAPDDPVLNELVGAAAGRLEGASACGLPDVLVHGDAHPGNARLGAGEPVVFDWGDSRLGNPVLDLDVLDRLDPAEAAELERHWLDRLRAALPVSDPQRAWGLLRPLAALRSGAVYQTFLDNIEPSERIYHEGDVMPALQRASRLARAQRSFRRAGRRATARSGRPARAKMQRPPESPERLPSHVPAGGVLSRREVCRMREDEDAGAAGNDRPIVAPALAVVAERLRAAGCVAAEEEAAEMMSSADDARVLEQWLRRREKGEPLAWITGWLQFCGHRLVVDGGIYVPRLQSERLARLGAAALARAAALGRSPAPPAGSSAVPAARPRRARAADLCTGAGAIAVHLSASVPDAFVVGVDSDRSAVACARRNGVRAVVGDLAGPLRPASFDLVTAVPPYVPTGELRFLPADVQRHEPLGALDGGNDGLGTLRPLVAGAARLLRPGGWLVVELGGEQDTALAPALADEGFANTASFYDEDGDLRGVTAQWSGGATVRP